jgi:phosphatidylglycerol:prolipoprotein diacylglycerol transferase
LLQTVFGVPLFGLLVAFGTLFTYLIATRLAKREGLDPEVVVDGTLIIMIGGVIGCRILHIIEFLPYFEAKPWTEVFRIDKGGLSWYGCFFTVMPAAWIYAKSKRIAFGQLNDLFVCYTILGQAIGRLGCFFNGCCWGHLSQGTAFETIGLRFPVGSPPWASHTLQELKVSTMTEAELMAVIPELPAALQQGALPVIPSQIFLSAGGFLVFATYLWFYGRHQKKHGQAFILGVGLLCLVRFLGEFLRADTAKVGPLTDAQWFSVLGMTIMLAMAGWIAKRGYDYARGLNPVTGSDTMLA